MHQKGKRKKNSQIMLEKKKKSKGKYITSHGYDISIRSITIVFKKWNIFHFWPPKWVNCAILFRKKVINIPNQSNSKSIRIDRVISCIHLTQDKHKRTYYNSKFGGALELMHEIHSSPPCRKVNKMNQQLLYTFTKSTSMLTLFH